MISVKKYKELAPQSEQIDSSFPEVYFPELHEGNYMEGYVIRFFLQERGGATPIIEVSEREYLLRISSNYWNRVTLKWRIIGKLNDTYTSNSDGVVIKELSVPHSNRLAIEGASKIIPDIKLYLVNLTQFYREDK